MSSQIAWCYYDINMGSSIACKTTSRGRRCMVNSGIIWGLLHVCETDVGFLRHFCSQGKLSKGMISLLTKSCLKYWPCLHFSAVQRSIYKDLVYFCQHKDFIPAQDLKLKVRTNMYVEYASFPQNLKWNNLNWSILWVL